MKSMAEFISQKYYDLSFIINMNRLATDVPKHSNFTIYDVLAAVLLKV
jgi:hypothetical protein